MKKLMIITGVLITSVSFGAENPALKKELTEKIILDLREIDLGENNEDFVVVSFTICEGEIEIAEITGTQKTLVQIVKNKLSQLSIQEEYTEDTIYRYKFTFEKH
jgi:uncharacterized membrane protein YciS (DUF1049 family)